MSSVSDVRGTGTWPKPLPAYTDDEQRVRDAFMARWLEYLPRRGGFLERFNHGYPATCRRERAAHPGDRRGPRRAHRVRGHRASRSTTPWSYAIELAREPERPDSRPSRRSLPTARSAFRSTTGSSIECSRSTSSSTFPTYPAALDEVARVLAPDGRFVAVIPCEGGAVVLAGAAPHLPAALRARVRSRLRLLHPVRAHQRAVGDRERVPEEVPRCGLAVLPVPDPVRQGQPRHRADDASTHLSRSAPGQAAVGRNDPAQGVDVRRAEIVGMRRQLVPGIPRRADELPGDPVALRRGEEDGEASRQVERCPPARPLFESAFVERRRRRARGRPRAPRRGAACSAPPVRWS